MTRDKLEKLLKGAFNAGADWLAEDEGYLPSGWKAVDYVHVPAPDVDNYVESVLDGLDGLEKAGDKCGLFYQCDGDCGPGCVSDQQYVSCRTGD